MKRRRSSPLPSLQPLSCLPLPPVSQPSTASTALCSLPLAVSTALCSPASSLAASTALYSLYSPLQALQPSPSRSLYSPLQPLQPERDGAGRDETRRGGTDGTGRRRARTHACTAPGALQRGGWETEPHHRAATRLSTPPLCITFYADSENDNFLRRFRTCTFLI